MSSCCVFALSDKVVFAPCNGNEIGLFDVTTQSFETVSTCALTMGYKFYGAATVGTKVVFAPYNASEIGLFDVTTKSFETVSTGALTIGSKFCDCVLNKWTYPTVRPQTNL